MSSLLLLDELTYLSPNNDSIYYDFIVFELVFSLGLLLENEKILLEAYNFYFYYNPYSIY